MALFTKSYDNRQQGKFIQNVSHLVTGVKIVASPFFVGMIIGLLIYTQYANTSTLLIALCTSMVGLLCGIAWATRLWSKERTLQFISRISRHDEQEKNAP